MATHPPKPHPPLFGILRKGESEARGEGGGIGFLIENPRRGGGEGEGVCGELREINLLLGRGGLNILFSGPKRPPRTTPSQAVDFDSFFLHVSNWGVILVRSFRVFTPKSLFCRLFPSYFLLSAWP